MLRKTLATLTLAALTTSTGCMAVSATDNSRGVKNQCQVVAVGNDVFLINTRTGEARKIDVSRAQPFNPAAEPANENYETEVEAGDTGR